MSDTRNGVCMSQSLCEMRFLICMSLDLPVIRNRCLASISLNEDECSMNVSCSPRRTSVHSEHKLACSEHINPYSHKLHEEPYEKCKRNKIRIQKCFGIRSNVPINIYIA